MRCLLPLACLLAVQLSLSPVAHASGTPAGILLPASCAPGWVMDGRAVTYTPDDLYKFIDGEAELYLPYGFEMAQTVMYVDPVHKGNGLVTSVFKMGSLLDAFGIYGNYRGEEAESARVGAEGFIEESQLMFYQGRYFVEIAASGSFTQEPSLFLACAAAISKHLPGDDEKPKELAYLRVPGLVPSTERYYADGLLGYGFFGRGLTGEVVLKGVRVKAFITLGASGNAIRGAFEVYVKRLKESKAPVQVSQQKGSVYLTATDPLYRGVVLQQSGRFAVGVAGLADPRDGHTVIEELLTRLPKER